MIKWCKICKYFDMSPRNLPVLLGVFMGECQQIRRSTTTITNHHRYRRFVGDIFQHGADGVGTTLQHHTDDWNTTPLHSIGCNNDIKSFNYSLQSCPNSLKNTIIKVTPLWVYQFKATLQNEWNFLPLIWNFTLTASCNNKVKSHSNSFINNVKSNYNSSILPSYT